MGPETREEPSNSTQMVTLAERWPLQGLRLEQSHLKRRRTRGKIRRRLRWDSTSESKRQLFSVPWVVEALFWGGKKNPTWRWFLIRVRGPGGLLVRGWLFSPWRKALLCSLYKQRCQLPSGQSRHTVAKVLLAALNASEETVLCWSTFKYPLERLNLAP